MKLIDIVKDPDLLPDFHRFAHLFIWMATTYVLELPQVEIMIVHGGKQCGRTFGEYVVYIRDLMLLMNTLSFISTESKLRILGNGFQHINVSLQVLFVSAPRMILVKTELILSASTAHLMIVNDSWSLSIGVPQM